MSWFSYLILSSLQATKHLKLNTKESPCEASDDYRFANCLENGILRQVGCQPFWIERKIEPVLPPCHSARKIVEVFAYFDFLQELALDELVTNYECLLPCEYTKYEVQRDYFCQYFLLLVFKTLGDEFFIDGVTRPHGSFISVSKPNSCNSKRRRCLFLGIVRGWHWWSSRIICRIQLSSDCGLNRPTKN